MSDWTDKAEGKAKEAMGSVTGDQSQQDEGRAQQSKGDLESAGNNVKDAAEKAFGNNS